MYAVIAVCNKVIIKFNVHLVTYVQMAFVEFMVGSTVKSVLALHD